MEKRIQARLIAIMSSIKSLELFQKLKNTGSLKHLKLRKERDAGRIEDAPFISMIGERSMNGLGTYYGTFIKEMESMHLRNKDI